jgi:hypothetical protein
MTIIKHEPWECPRCKVINAPWVAQCTCHPEREEKNSIEDNCIEKDTPTIKTADVKCKSKSDHEWECIGVSTGGDTYRCKKCGELRYYLLDGSIY